MVEVVGQVVVAGGDDELAGAVGDGAVEAVGCMDGKGAVRTRHALDGLVLADVEGVVLGDLAVVFEGLAAGGLLVGAGEGHVADLEQLGGGEEGHVRGVVEERVAEAALVDEHGGEAGALRLDGAGHAGGAGADDQQVVGCGGGGVAHGLILSNASLVGPPIARIVRGDPCDAVVVPGRSACDLAVCVGEIR
jgi:hypothetical protein